MGANPFLETVKVPCVKMSLCFTNEHFIVTNHLPLDFRKVQRRAASRAPNGSILWFDALCKKIDACLLESDIRARSSKTGGGVKPVHIFFAPVG
jgi:hypothetical protein